MCAAGHHSGDGHNHDSSGDYSMQMPRAVQRNVDYSQTDSVIDYPTVKYR